MKKKDIGLGLLILLLLGVFTVFLRSSPLIQNEDYHNFSDNTTLLGIPNFWNVVSNLPFLLVGFLGMFRLSVLGKSKLYYHLFFASIALVSIGSGYYHYHPTTQTLVWDRLPMTFAFMALFSIIISEFINEKLGRLLFVPFLSLGVLSIVIWVISADLRYYAMVQFLPLIAIPIILIFYKSTYTLISRYWLVLLFYALAKVFEHFDSIIYDKLVFMSGHTLKHFAASLSIFVLYFTLQNRKKIECADNLISNVNETKV